MKETGADYQKKKREWLLFSVVILIVIFCAIYLSDYYPADREALLAFTIENPVEVQQLGGNGTVYLPEEADVGFIFYPGGKVEHTAYEPLMKALASEGILCVLLEMPFRLAVLDMDGASGVPDAFPEIETWYLGGHSLGGSMAASYLAEETELYAGLVLLGSYSTADLSETSLEVLSIYGSEDEVLNHEKYDKYVEMLPEDFEELVLEGGCHAYFGMYGEQKGDGIPKLTNEEQIRITADTIVKWVQDLV